MHEIRQGVAYIDQLGSQERIVQINIWAGKLRLYQDGFDLPAEIETKIYYTFGADKREAARQQDQAREKEIEQQRRDEAERQRQAEKRAEQAQRDLDALEALLADADPRSDPELNDASLPKDQMEFLRTDIDAAVGRSLCLKW